MALKEKCGIFGIYGKNLDVSRLTFYGLFALQHRGQEASGIAVANDSGIDFHKDLGLVTHVYSESDIARLQGSIAIGQNLYTTCRASDMEHIQPVIREINGKPILALAHNGNLPSTNTLTNFLLGKGINITNHNDSELMADAIVYYLAQGDELVEAVKKSYPLFTGCFSLLIMNNDTLIALRDRCGVRPLAMGCISTMSVACANLYDNPYDKSYDNSVVFASETCAFHTIGADFVREVRPGEMVVVNERGVQSHQLEPANLKLDLFEFVYFSRPDSDMLGKSVYEVRRNSGVELAIEYPLDVDMVIPVPDTAIPAAIGYARTLNVPYEMALTKNKYIHRTFIQPDQYSRELGVKLKLSSMKSILKGKKIAVIDDSIVRGTTSRQIVTGLFEAGAKEVHFVVSSPPVKFPDFYGIDTPHQKKLIASSKSIAEIREFLGASSLYFLSLEGLLRATAIPKENLCLACFTGEYPIDLLERVQEVSYVHS